MCLEKVSWGISAAHLLLWITALETPLWVFTPRTLSLGPLRLVLLLILCPLIMCFSHFCLWIYFIIVQSSNLLLQTLGHFGRVAEWMSEELALYHSGHMLDVTSSKEPFLTLSPLHPGLDEMPLTWAAFSSLYLCLSLPCAVTSVHMPCLPLQSEWAWVQT